MSTANLLYPYSQYIGKERTLECCEIVEDCRIGPLTQQHHLVGDWMFDDDGHSFTCSVKRKNVQNFDRDFAVIA